MQTGKHDSAPAMPPSTNDPAQPKYKRNPKKTDEPTPKHDLKKKEIKKNCNKEENEI